jgi:hypothetical protein
MDDNCLRIFRARGAHKYAKAGQETKVFGYRFYVQKG